jgi:hypothetical protein
MLKEKKNPPVARRLYAGERVPLASREHILYRGPPPCVRITHVRGVYRHKVYDTIPRELRFSELEANGITRNMLLSFMKALYMDSTIQVKTREAPGVSSDPIPIERGLRQGRCPASPILFTYLIYMHLTR